MPITLAPTSLDVGGHLAQTTVSFQVTAKGSNDAFTASIISGGGPGTFSVSPASGTATSAGVPLTVTFVPSGVGAVTATLKVHKTGGAVVTAALTGVGIEPPNPETMGGSHLLIAVPDYGDTTYVKAAAGDKIPGGIDPTGLDGRTLNSYLRLGAFDYTRESAAAKQLLQIIPKGGAARDPRSDPSSSMLLAANPSKGIPEIGGTVFVDDVRTRAQDLGTSLVAADDPDHGLTKSERQNESAKLYARGGWRDHSDGNRISTTWGDKVEVVRGNYKMMVLGRQNDPAKSMGWEASGGHIQDHAPGTMPGASFWLEWIDDTRFYATVKDGGGDGRKGAWLLVNTTENVYQFARTAGTLRSENWGDVHESYIGSETPPTTSGSGRADGDALAIDAEHGTGGHSVSESMKIAGRNYLTTTPPDANDQAGKIRSNPHLISKTWAERIDSYTGTSAWRIPDNFSETWGKRTETLVDVEERIISNTRAGNIVEATTAGTITGATTAANIAELTTAGIHTEVHIGGAHLEMEVGIFHGELEIALKGAIQIAGGYEVTIGSLAEFRLDTAKMRLVNKDTDLEKVTIALNDFKAALYDSNTTLARKETTLSAVLTALTVQLGI